MHLSICSDTFKYENGIFSFEAQELDTEQYFIISIEQCALEAYYSEECVFDYKECSGRNRVAIDAADALLEQSIENFQVRSAEIKQVEFFKGTSETITVPGHNFLIEKEFSHAIVIAHKNSFQAHSHNIVLA